MLSNRDKLCGAIAAFFCALLLMAQDAWAQEAAFSYDATGLRNPFIPLVTSDGRLIKVSAGSGAGDLVLEGIIYEEKGESYAIVNATIVRPGDVVNGWGVERVEQNKVIISKGSELRELEIATGE
ncbi:MAG: hypothetical protein Q8O22_07085 [Candidatus Omnitrophota bacterium]|nr:hypothetical protein [Candidatus Omnitrophota bacterium]